MVAKRKGAKLGAKVGARVAPKAGRVASRAAWRAGKGQARLTRRALSSREPRAARYVKYGFFALAGLALGAVLSRFGSRDDTSSSFTDATGQQDQTWGTGTAGGATAGQTDVGTVPSEHQRPEDPNRTGPEREYSDPSAGPLIGRDRPSEPPPEIPVQHEEVENRIRTRIGEDPRTMDIPHVNVEVNDGVAELRGVAPSEEAKQAAGEIAASVEGVSEVRNLITVS
jgi:BON domain